MGSIAYGGKIPKNIKVALMVDEFNDDNMWKRAINAGVSTLMTRYTSSICLIHEKILAIGVQDCATIHDIWCWVRRSP